jgi:hypothetical protein
VRQGLHSITGHGIIGCMPEQESIQVSMIWPDVGELPVYRANQFLGQVSNGPDGKPEDLLLTIGHFAPPVLLGPPEEQQVTARALGAVSVRALSRISLSYRQAHALVGLLQHLLGQFPAPQEEEVTEEDS